jgi:hypothetical protein
MFVLQNMSLPRVTISDFSTAGDGITVSSSGIDVGDADANTPYVTLDDVAIYKHDLVILFVKTITLSVKNACFLDNTLKYKPNSQVSKLKNL